MPERAEKIVIVGAGAAGLMAAATLSSAGRSSLVLESGDQAGRKVLVAGGGRCNFTHDLPPQDLLKRFPTRAARFLKPAVYDLPPSALREFLAALGVASTVESDGCVFPASNQSRDILSALLRAARPAAEIRTGLACRRILVDGDSAAGDDVHVTGVETEAGTIAAEAVILATGGPAWPAAGGSAAGLELLRQLGHAVVAPRPGLSPLWTRADWTRRLQGVSLDRARLTCRRGGATVEGPLIFTHFGLSGPAALDLSLQLEQLPAEVRLAILPDLTPAELERLLVGAAAAEGGRSLLSALAEMTAGSPGREMTAGVPRRLLEEAVAESCGGGENTSENAGGRSGSSRSGPVLSQLSRPQRQALARALTDLPIVVERLGDWSQAMVTVGGCRLDEVDPRTMASRRIAGLYVVGELLDIAGPTGGFNLHAALATGRLAALAQR